MLHGGLTAGGIMADERVLAKGMGVLGLAIRKEPRVFDVSVTGSVLFSLLTMATAYVLGGVVGQVIVPAIEDGQVSRAADVGGAALILAVSVGKVIGLWGRRLGAGAMQYRLQA